MVPLDPAASLASQTLYQTGSGSRDYPAAELGTTVVSGVSGSSVTIVLLVSDDRVGGKKLLAAVG